MSSSNSVFAKAGSVWSEARVERLNALLLQGLSASQIAKALGGVSRNAVIGKSHRLGLAGGSPPSPPGRRATIPARAARPRKAPVPRCPRPPTPEPPSGGASAAAVRRRPASVVEAIGRVADLTALPRRACRWPIGDPKDAAFSWCGASAPLGPYCDDHRARAYRATPVRVASGRAPAGAGRCAA
ncbi:GcrA family cell cycle regulator [Caulobacter endophyticus]|uniref:GcrA cell cycle regulator n=1 Tax=Caulobacter endophyticus TaxID=2172652 RepID=A0A2T9JY13_9CAUL|nr:GcrA family cell cycle regulator [Caulobacter endophyticus]PVM88600.1 GcrA cell cycle regulator [Caulobacter endophyticus]